MPWRISTEMFKELNKSSVKTVKKKKKQNLPSHRRSVFGGHFLVALVIFGVVWMYLVLLRSRCLASGVH